MIRIGVKDFKSTKRNINLVSRVFSGIERTIIRCAELRCAPYDTRVIPMPNRELTEFHTGKASVSP